MLGTNFADEPKYWSDSTPVAGQQFTYAFDDIGNRTSTGAGGDSTGNTSALRQANYHANALNQYTNRDVPGAVDVMGLALATNNTVSVNSQTPYKKIEYFRQQMSVNNSNAPVWQSVTVSATNEISTAGNVFVAKSPEHYTYDVDGNLLTDGRWNYAWDAENRLVAMVANSTNVGPQQKLAFEYDAQGRRIHKQVWGNTAGSGSPTNDVKFLYEGWNVLATLGSSSSVLQSCLWGTDVSGSIQSAGGIGGLVEVNVVGNGVQFSAFDGNGNVAAFVSAVGGTNSAQYEYGPFGEVIRASGSLAKANPFRFSTKYQDDETDLVYYGYRYYGASAGRWLSRDPSEEEDGGAPLYGFVCNNGVSHLDYLGLDWKIIRSSGRNWAAAVGFNSDTVAGLAKLLHLEPTEYRRWLRTVNWDRQPSGEPLPGSPNDPIGPCGGYFLVPNTVIVYTSKKSGVDWLQSPVVNALRRLAVKGGKHYESKGYKVIYKLRQSSEQLFINLWTTDGIFAYAFGGHGAEDYGFVAEPGSESAVGPDQVHPPYHLQAIGAYSCYSADPIQNTSNPTTTSRWIDLISHDGTFVGFHGSVWWGNLWWNEVVQNPGVIPP